MPKAIHPYEVLRRPLVTEKTTMLAAHSKFVFEVALGANKPQIAAAVELAFNVHVVDVNTAHVRGKLKRYGKGIGRQASWKKAVVTLRPGEQIQVFEGV
jgi:large subunit ribosomal protein L23